MKNLVISGGTGTIGSLLVEALVDEGYFITVVGRGIAPLPKRNSNVKFYKLDISSTQDVKDFFTFFSKNYKSLFGLINAAGTQSPIGKFINSKMSVWKTNVKINVFGTANMIKYSLPLFKTAGRGKIINFSGGGATSNRPSFSAYALSKISLVKLTEVLSSELKCDYIDINAVSPGAINSKMLDEIIEAGEEMVGDEYPSAVLRKKNGGDTSHQVVNLCKFLLSDASDGISGKLISALWDDFDNPEFLSRLKFDDNFCTLRRIDKFNYDKIK